MDFSQEILDECPELKKYDEMEELVFNPTEENIPKFKEILSKFSKNELPTISRTIIKASSVRDAHFNIFIQMSKLLPKVDFRVSCIPYCYVLADEGLVTEDIKRSYLRPDFTPPIIYYEKNSVEEAIANDDLDRVVFLSTEDNFFNQKKRLKTKGTVPLLSFAAFYGSTHVFNYLVLNGAKIDETTISFAIKGGCEEIISTISQRTNCSFNDQLLNAVMFHRNNLIPWLLQNYQPASVTLNQCIFSFNTLAFYFFAKNGTTPATVSPLLEAFNAGSYGIINYLMKKESSYSQEIKEKSIAQAKTNRFAEIVNEFVLK